MPETGRIDEDAMIGPVDFERLRKQSENFDAGEEGTRNTHEFLNQEQENEKQLILTIRNQIK